MKHIHCKICCLAAFILLLPAVLLPFAQASQPEPLTADIVRERETVYYGDLVTYTYTIHGGTGLVHFYIDWYVNGEIVPEYSRLYSSSEHRPDEVPWGNIVNELGECYFKLTVWDDVDSLEVSGAVTTVIPYPGVALMMDRREALVGEAIIWKMEVLVGQGTLAFDFHVFRDDVEVDASGWTDDPAFAHTTTQAGTYYAIVHYRNNIEEFQRRSPSALVSDPILLTLNVNRTEVHAGEAVTWTIETTGDVAVPAVDFHILDDNDEIIFSSEGTLSSFSHAFVEPGTYRAVVKYSIDGEVQEAWSDYTIVSEVEGDDLSVSMFALTQAACTERALMETILGEFGQTAVLADWKELKELYGETLPSVMESLGLADTECAWLIYNSQNWYDARSVRHYFLQRFDSGAPNGFLAHDQVGTIYLGSWYGINARVLVRFVGGTEN